MIRNSGAWIFLSHSSKDWQQIRLIRNTLEEKGHNPLLFHLKCVNEQEELNNLIKREIEARNWFLLCRSQFSDTSKWVKTEVEYIKSLPHKQYEEIDLSDNVETQLIKINRLLSQATVFISYTYEDRDISDQINRKLIEADFSVWRDPEFGEDWANHIKTGIKKTKENGFFLYIFSKNSFIANSQEAELELALKNDPNNIIPILLDDGETDLWGLIPSKLMEINFFKFNVLEFESSMTRLIIQIKSITLDH